MHRREAAPLPVAIIELAEGPWLRMQVQGDTATEVAVGVAVEDRFATPDGGEPIPYAALVPNTAQNAG